MAIKTGSACRRCHSHEGAVLGGANGFTGSEDILDNPVYQGAVPLQKEFSVFECGTCHEHGGGMRQVTARDAAGNIVNWNPSKSNLANDQFNLCTSCHTLKTFDGSQLLATGNVVTWGTVTAQTGIVGHHDTSWYRVLASTHYNNLDNPAAGGISGYVIREKGESPCYDCHGHEARTNTSKVNDHSATYDSANETIYTEWSKSGHAGKLLKAKVDVAGTASGTTTLVESIIVTTVGEAAATQATAPAWNHYDWSGTSRQACQRCHTATGASNYLSGPATYNAANNSFTHLYDNATKKYWSTSSRAATQREMLYCWGCHENVSGEAGGIRNPGAITADWNYNGAKAQFPDTGSSNVCIACHVGRDSGETITSKPTASFDNTGFVNSHYMSVAGLMYVKIGFTAFVDPSTVIGTSTYGASLTSTDDGGAVRSTHRNFGSTAMIGDHGITASDTQFLSNGPCVTCHLTKETGKDRHHTLEIDKHAFNNVCVKCHDEEHGTPLTEDNFATLFLEEQSEVFQDALTVAKTILKNKYHITYNPAAHPYFFDDDAANAAVTNWTRPVALPGAGGTALSLDDAKKLMGACFNVNLLAREPGAFAHARTYTRRLIYDSIDFLDDQTINMTTGATVLAADPAIYVKGTSATDPATTEAFKYLAGYNRTSGAWNALERP
jgi:mono/diheme cytochrome c family protein